MARFEVYKDNAGEYRWRLRAEDDEIMAISSQGYEKMAECLAALYFVKQRSPNAPVIDLTGGVDFEKIQTRMIQSDSVQQKGALVRLGGDIVFKEMPQQQSDIQVHLL